MPKDKPDEKIRKLIADKAEPLDPGTRGEIIQHIARARFSDRKQPLAKWERVGPTYVGRRHPSKPQETLALTTVLDCAEFHATKHIAKGEWAPDTTTEEYLDDLRASISHGCAILDVGDASIRCGNSMDTTRAAPRAGVRTDMTQAHSTLKKATKLHGRVLLTVYAVDTKKLVTGYQLEAKSAEATVKAWANHRAFP